MTTSPNAREYWWDIWREAREGFENDYAATPVTDSAAVGSGHIVHPGCSTSLLLEGKHRRGKTRHIMYTGSSIIPPKPLTYLDLMETLSYCSRDEAYCYDQNASYTKMNRIESYEENVLDLQTLCCGFFLH